MKKIILFIIGGILLVLVMAIGLYLHFTADSRKVVNLLQQVNNGVIEETVIANGISLTNGKVEYVNGIYYVHMTATNNTDETVDMGIFRISFKDINGEELDFFTGDIFGAIEPGDSVDTIVESYSDLSKLASVFYQPFTFGG